MSQHITPAEDSFMHGFEDCECGPDVRRERREDGTYGWVYTHHALTGPGAGQLKEDA